VIVAVAARNLKSAKDFSGKFGIARFYDRYEALGEDSEVGMYVFKFIRFHCDT